MKGRRGRQEIYKASVISVPAAIPFATPALKDVHRFAPTDPRSRAVPSSFILPYYPACGRNDFVVPTTGSIWMQKKL
jgi:hypothetical protein